MLYNKSRANTVTGVGPKSSFLIGVLIEIGSFPIYILSDHTSISLTNEMSDHHSSMSEEWTFKLKT